MGCKINISYSYVMYDSIYEMVYQELIEGGDKFKNLNPRQKQFVAEKLTISLMVADPEKPVSFEEAGRQVDVLYEQALNLK